MSGLIKSGDMAQSGAVRPFRSLRPSPPEAVIDPELFALRAEVEDLQLKLAERDAVILRHQDELERARKDGEAEGRREALKTADDGRVERLSKLEAGLRLALDRFGQEMTALDRLACLLASEALDKILGDPGARAELVLAAIRQRLETIDAQAIVRIEVSPEDFPEPEALQALAGEIARPPLALQATAGLPPGGCRIKLQIGALEVGVDQQWSRLRAALEQMAEPGTER